MNLGHQQHSANQEGRGILRGTTGIAVMLPLVATVSACDWLSPNNRSETVYDGFEFKSRTEQVEEDRSHFQVEVRRASQSLDGAKAAGHHAGTRYCIAEYGSSKIDWIKGPYRENDTIVLVDGNLYLEGICVI